jgi:hypothetical protein
MDRPPQSVHHLGGLQIGLRLSTSEVRVQLGDHLLEPPVLRLDNAVLRDSLLHGGADCLVDGELRVRAPAERSDLHLDDAELCLLGEQRCLLFVSPLEAPK